MSSLKKIPENSGTNIILYNLNYTEELLAVEPYMLAFPAWRAQRYLPNTFDLPDRTPGKHVVIVSAKHIPETERELAYSLLSMSEIERARVTWLCPHDPKTAFPTTRAFVDTETTWAALQSVAREAQANAKPISVHSFCANDWITGVSAKLGATMFESSEAIADKFGTKFQSKITFDLCGVPTAPWNKQLRYTVEEINQDVKALIALHPELTLLMLKLSDSGWGGGVGNMPLDIEAFKQHGNIRTLGVLKSMIPRDQLFKSLEKSGAILECMIPNLTSCPSIQVEITPDGTINILSTHDQILGKDGDYRGALFPADAAKGSDSTIRKEMIAYATKVAQTMHTQDYHGTFGIDFGVADAHRVVAFEINARNTGTCHPQAWAKGALRGNISINDGLLRNSNGDVRYYHHERVFGWANYERHHTFESVTQILKSKNLLWDHTTQQGCLPGALSGIAVCGFMEITAIAENPNAATEIFKKAKAALDRAAGVALDHTQSALVTD